MKRTLWLCTGFLGIAAGLFAGPIVLFDNLASGITGGVPIEADGPLYQSFSTGASAFSFDDVMLELVTGSTSGSITVALYADNSGTPGDELDDIFSLPGTYLHPSPFPIDVPLGTPYDLTADTNYWIGLSSTDDSGATWLYPAQPS